ncbi:RNA polymerase sigma factor [Massilia sp. TS11]|uniref:RNA polymerase sigma factor n=1 Tax=Massilia sp. TS11 TaxID=2908003 RepID=UPI001EDAD39A|nr:DUF6596 domain-containing protein [Massilia sp. TS11]MCG2584930.1 RNA polymerase subunit sigma-70 [Massilia sp. TS11]
MADAVALAVEQAARTACRRLVAYLAARSGHVAAAEDALADAFCAALEAWPRSGVPQVPEAWLLTAARRRLIDAQRHHAVRDAAAPGLLAIADAALALSQEDTAFPDERLKLMFVCAHPAIDAAARTPLMLQVVLGVDAAAIASAFVLKPAAMGQRLARAKAKIRDAAIPYALPDLRELPSRLDAVLQAVYGAYGMGWDALPGADPFVRGLAQSALELGALLEQWLPAEPEAKGLLALMLHCEARRPARRDAGGAYVPLSAQDPAHWNAERMAQADHLLAAAAGQRRLGRFQLEAAIQSVHARRAVTGSTDWVSIAALYDGLIQQAPTLGVAVARAAAWAQVSGPQAGLALLAALAPESVRSYQPYWALAGELRAALGDAALAAEAWRRAIALCVDPAARAFLQQRLDALAI